MNYDKARQMQDGTWNYSRQHDNMIYPIGYCRTHELNESWHKHTTQQEAEECYKQYQLDNSLRLEGGIMSNTKVKCQVDGCEEYSGVTSYIDYECFVLCPTHRTKEVIATMFDCSGESIHS